MQHHNTKPTLHLYLAISAALTLINLAPPLATAAIFQGLGFLPGGEGSLVTGLSGDGSVVVGYGSIQINDDTFTNQAFRWTRDSGMQGLGGLPGMDNSIARGVSADGSVIAGTAYSTSGDKAFRWTSDAGMQDLGNLGGASDYVQVHGISADGSTIVGESSSPSSDPYWEAFRWTSDGGMQGLGHLPEFATTAYSVSGNGSVIVGFAHDNYFNEGYAFIWTSAGGMQRLGDVIGGDIGGILLDDGSIMGQAQTASGLQLFRWTSDDGIQFLDDLIGDLALINLNRDGSVITSRDTDYVTYIWDAAKGNRPFESMLVSDYGLDFTGWTLGPPSGISNDGRTIVGTGINPSGQEEAWIVTIPVPEPASVSLLSFGAICLLWRCRGRAACHIRAPE